MHKSLAERKVSVAFAPPNQIDGIDGEEDAHHFVDLIKGGKPKVILNAMHKTATNPTLRMTAEPSLYEVAFFNSFHGKMQEMSDKDIKKLHTQLNNPKMRKMRGGLEFAALQGFGATERGSSAGARRGLATTHEHFEKVGKMVVAEMSQRGMKMKDSDFEQTPALRDWRGARQAKKRIAAFCALHRLIVFFARR